EEPVLLRQPGLLARFEDRVWGREVPLQPLDAGGVEIAAVELGKLGLGQEMPQDPADAAAEVEYPLPLPGPVRAEGVVEHLPGHLPRGLVDAAGVLFAHRADPAEE